MTYNEDVGKCDEQSLVECAIFDSLELFDCQCRHCIEIHERAMSRYHADETRQQRIKDQGLVEIAKPLLSWDIIHNAIEHPLSEKEAKYLKDNNLVTTCRTPNTYASGVFDGFELMYRWALWTLTGKEEYNIDKTEKWIDEPDK